ncbi:MAG: hypothetical protein NTV34_02030 [Proteobacteria bacterium]|nr:hypothetical protein [Pseudomonadota bacterium]
MKLNAILFLGVLAVCLSNCSEEANQSSGLEGQNVRPRQSFEVRLDGPDAKEAYDALLAHLIFPPGSVAGFARTISCNRAMNAGELTCYVEAPIWANQGTSKKIEGGGAVLLTKFIGDARQKAKLGPGPSLMAGMNYQLSMADVQIDCYAGDNYCHVDYTLPYFDKDWVRH